MKMDLFQPIDGTRIATTKKRRSFNQDRLGRNRGKVEKQEVFYADPDWMRDFLIAALHGGDFRFF